MCSAFLWSGPGLNTRKAKVAWEDLCVPKAEGGLGFRSLTDVNMVFGLKLIYRVLTSTTSLWVNWVKEFLIREGSFWSASEDKGSWMWRKLLKLRSLAFSFVRVEIGDGTRTSFWFDQWLPLGRLYDFVGFRGFRALGISRQATVAQAALTGWVFRPQRTLPLQLIVPALQQVSLPLPVSNTDQFLWRKNNEQFGVAFSAKNTYNQIRSSHTMVEWAATVWFSEAVPKYAFLTWLAFKDRLSTGDRMIRWSQNANGTCIFCLHPLETRSHLFFECPYASEVWSITAKGILRLRFTSVWEDIVALLYPTRKSDRLQVLLRFAFQCTLHHIWLERNGRRHGQPLLSAKQLANQIDRAMRNKFLSLRSPDDRTNNDLLILWFGTRL